jgi:hypothetical protein
MFSLHENLYHYTKAITLIDKILPSMSIQMGVYKDLNDPREAKTWPFIFYSRDVETNDRFKTELFEEVSSYLTNTTLIFSCTKDDPSVIDGDHDREIRSGYGHPRMWAQYGDKHKGVCLVLNHEALHRSMVSNLGNKGLYCGDVQYLETVTGPYNNAYHIKYLDDILKAGIASVIEPHIDEFSKELFFTKHIDWRDEWEYRWVFRSQDGEPKLIPIEDSIRAVIIGNDCPAKETINILNACSCHRIPVFKLFQHGWSMSLMPIDTTEENVISLSGISFSTNIPCTGVFAQAHDINGKVRPILINNAGEVIVLE